MIRLLQLAKAIRQVGYRPILLYQDFAGGDEQAMRAFWGDDLHWVPYRADSLRWSMRRRVRNLMPPGSRPYRWAMRLQSALKKYRRHRRGTKELLIGLDDWYDPSLTCHVRDISQREKPCAAICLDVFLTRSFEGLDNSVLRILDTNDLYAVGRETDAAKQELWVNFTLKDELRGFRRADIVWAIQGRDEEKIKLAAPEVRTMTVGHPVELAAPDFDSALRSREILLVASKHKWNVQGLRWFAAEVYPLLQERLPQKRVLVAGDIGDVLEGELPFQFLGRAAELLPIYRRARLVISPILGGAGLKIKNIEPMGYGKAVVSTRSAAAGLEAAENRAFLVGESPASFAQAVRRVMEEDDLCRRLMEEAYAFAQEWNQGVEAALRRSFAAGRTQDREGLGVSVCTS